MRKKDFERKALVHGVLLGRIRTIIDTFDRFGARAHALKLIKLAYRQAEQEMEDGEIRKFPLYGV